MRIYTFVPIYTRRVNGPSENKPVFTSVACARNVSSDTASSQVDSNSCVCVYIGIIHVRIYNTWYRVK